MRSSDDDGVAVDSPRGPVSAAVVCFVVEFGVDDVVDDDELARPKMVDDVGARKGCGQSMSAMP